MDNEGENKTKEAQRVEEMSVAYAQHELRTLINEGYKEG